jgi:hypothetical protein
MIHICEKCRQLIHREIVGFDYMWLHDDYKSAWQVDEKGYAHNLHFVKQISVPEEELL